MSDAESVDVRTRLHSVIWSRVWGLTLDCDTFLWARAYEGDILTNSEAGGGNYLMAAGLFSLLNFLAKVWAQLNNDDGTKFVTVDDVQRVDKLRKRIAASLTDPAEIRVVTDRLKVFLDDLVGSESNAFANFVQVANASGFDLGIPDDGGKTSKKIWRTFRNPLSHMAATLGGDISAHGRIQGMTIQQARLEVQKGRPAFYRSDHGRWVTNGDRLSHDIRMIGRWLARKVDEFDKESVTRTLDWINRVSPD